MMKKFVSITVVILAFLTVVSCASLENDSLSIYDIKRYNDTVCIDDSYTYISTEFSDIPVKDADDSAQVLEYGSHFRVLQTSFLPNPLYYRFDIYNSSGEIVKSETIWRVQPRISYLNENILIISISPGTNVRLVQFYSMEEDVFSDIFESPFLLTDEIIAYISRDDDGIYELIIRDIFDMAVYYMEFSFEDFTFTGSPFNAVIDIEYVGDGYVNVTYWSTAEHTEKNISLQLQK